MYLLHVRFLSFHVDQIGFELRFVVEYFLVDSCIFQGYVS